MERNKVGLLTFLSSLYILHSIPVIGYYTPAVFFGAIVLLLYLAVIITVGFNSFLRILLLSLPIVCIPFMRVLLSFFSDSNNLLIEVYSFFQLLLYPILGFYILHSKNTFMCKTLMAVVVLFYTVTAVTTIVGCNLYPNAARALTGHQDDIVLYGQYKRMNIGDFHFVYFLALTLPLLIGSVRFFKIKKIIGYTLIAISVTAVYYAAYSTALLFTVVALLLLIIPKTIQIRYLVGIIFFSFLLIIPARLVLSNLFSSMSESVGNEDVSSRLNDMSVVFSGGSFNQLEESSDMSTRVGLFSRSWEAFESSPIWGIWETKKLGGHSFFLDTLGLFGIGGLFLMIWMYIYIYKKFLFPQKKKKWFIFLFSSYILIIIQAILNPQPSINVLSFIFPLYTCLMNKESK